MPSNDDQTVHFDLNEFRNQLEAIIDQSEIGLINEQNVMREVARLWTNLSTARAEFLAAFGHLIQAPMIQQEPPPPGTMPRVVVPGGHGPNGQRHHAIPPYQNGGWPQ